MLNLFSVKFCKLVVERSNVTFAIFHNSASVIQFFLRKEKKRICGIPCEKKNAFEENTDFFFK